MALVTVTITGARAAAGLEEAKMAIVFGCQTHCAQGMDPIVFAQITSALPNVTHVRDELFFNSIYTHDTQSYAIPTGGTFDNYLNELASSGLGMIVELLWGDADQDGNVFNMPRGSSANRASFAGYASFILDEIKARSIPIAGAHLWNEISGSWPGIAGKTYSALTEQERVDLATDYILLAQDVFDLLNTDHPDVPFGVGADVALTLDWLNRAIPGGVLQYADALDLHPYGGTANLAAVQTLMAAEGQSSMPIWVTEYGATADTATVVRQAVEMMAAGSTIISFYLAKPFGAFAVNAALMDASGVPTPSGDVFDRMAGYLGDSTYSAEISGIAGVRAEKFVRAGADDVTVLWSPVGGVGVTISSETSIENIDGTPVTQAENYVLSTTPIYVFGDSVAIAAGVGDTLLADVTADFQLVTQGDPFFYRHITAGVEDDMTASTTNNRWQNGAQSFWYISSNRIHPPTGATNFSFLEWFVPAGVTRLKITGALGRPQSGGDGSDFWIEHEGTARFRRLAFPKPTTPETIFQVFDVTEGDSIRIRAGSGAAGSNSFDELALIGIAFFSTPDTVTSPDLGPVPIALYIKDEGGDTLYTLVLDTSKDAVTGRKNATWVDGFFDPLA